MLLQSSAIKSNPELAEEIKRATSSYRDEAEDFRYGKVLSYKNRENNQRNDFFIENRTYLIRLLHIHYYLY